MAEVANSIVLVETTMGEYSSSGPLEGGAVDTVGGEENEGYSVEEEGKDGCGGKEGGAVSTR